MYRLSGQQLGDYLSTWLVQSANSLKCDILTVLYRKNFMIRGPAQVIWSVSFARNVVVIQTSKQNGKRKWGICNIIHFYVQKENLNDVCYVFLNVFSFRKQSDQQLYHCKIQVVEKSWLPGSVMFRYWPHFAAINEWI